MTVVRMTKPYGILSYIKLSKHDALEALADILVSGEKDLDDCFEIIHWDLTDDIDGMTEKPRQAKPRQVDGKP